MSTSNQQEHDTPSEKDNWFIKSISSPVGIILLFVSIICICWTYPLWLPTICTSPPDEQATFGTYGDQYGALNTLFSGLAFAGLTLAILLQREDLKLQREEMREARTEAAKQTKEAAAQTALMAEQMLNASMAMHLDSMQKHKECIHILYEKAMSPEESRIPEAIGAKAVNLVYNHLTDLVEGLSSLNFVIKQHMQTVLTRNFSEAYFGNIDSIQQPLYILYSTMGYFSSWVAPFALWNRKVYQSQMTDEKKREYGVLMFDHLTVAERFTILVYSIIERTSLYRNGSDTPPDPSVLGDLWLSVRSITSPESISNYEGGLALLYHLLERRIYGREALVQRITAFYERRFEDILREAPVSAEDTPSRTA